jgi:hypothetical protein
LHEDLLARRSTYLEAKKEFDALASDGCGTRQHRKNVSDTHVKAREAYRKVLDEHTRYAIDGVVPERLFFWRFIGIGRSADLNRVCCLSV